MIYKVASRQPTSETRKHLCDSEKFHRAKSYYSNLFFFSYKYIYIYIYTKRISIIFKYIAHFTRAININDVHSRCIYDVEYYIVEDVNEEGKNREKERSGVLEDYIGRVEKWSNKGDEKERFLGEKG